MLKKIYNIIFVVAFLAVLAVPLLLTDFSDKGVSEDENRTLAAFPRVSVDGKWNDRFTAEFETWFMDHMGLRQDLIAANATLQFKGFNRMLETSSYLLGRNGDINYATEAMLKDYAHVNLRSEEQVARIGQSYQTINNWLEAQGIEFYYVQCFDKHSIYPEQFSDTVKQIGDVSKTDQVIGYLQENTTVNTVSMKVPMLEAKPQYEVYSNWGDPTHWTDRGAYMGYRYLLERMNANRETTFAILQEDAYNIEIKNGGITLNKVIHQDDMLEYFTVREPNAQKQEDKTVMGKWAEDRRHSRWENAAAGNGVKVLIMGDSYFNNHLVDDLAESFSELWMVWGEYTKELPEIVALYQPDIVIYECAERVDRSSAVCDLAESLS